MELGDRIFFLKKGGFCAVVSYTAVLAWVLSFMLPSCSYFCSTWATLCDIRSLYRRCCFSQGCFWGCKGEIGDLVGALIAWMRIKWLCLLPVQEHSEGTFTILLKWKMAKLGCTCLSWDTWHPCSEAIACVKLPALHRAPLTENLDIGGDSIQTFVRKWVAATSPHSTFSIVLLYSKEFSICSWGEKS